MNNFVGISPKLSSIFSQYFHGFINIHEYYNMIISKFDHYVKHTIVFLSNNLKPSLVL